MIPALTAEHWNGKNVLILGLGQYPQGSGVSAALLFARLGARVTVTDKKTKKELAANVKQLQKYKNVRFVLGKHDLNDVRNADLVVPNQRVRQQAPEIKLARKKGIPIQTEMSLFLNHCPARVIAVTGTRGKSTTAALIAHILKGTKGKKAWLGGNILVSPLTFLDKLKPNHDVVLELSSFQTEWLERARPVEIALFTNLLRDHQDAYASMDEYAEAKAQLFRYQTPEHIAIFNRDDAYGKEWANQAASRVIFFSKKDPVPPSNLLGEHNKMNIRAATAAANAAGIPAAIIRKQIKSFKGLSNRQELIATKNGIRYINDTTATAPDGTIAAINALAPETGGTLWLIAGGADKGLEYADLAKTAFKHRKHLQILLLPGDASKKLSSAVKTSVPMTNVKTVQDAVKKASALAKKGDIIALSPGAASFNQFKNEFHRGEVFTSAVRKQGT